mmetsp:Transcript_3726/g.9386  ORF Transcript_3726/g.9386 Transcript_3726/m.9386 type:complete len:222 (+) Transcript_3726:61-726(+)
MLNVIKPLCDRTPDEKPAAQKNHTKTHDALKRLLKRKDNRVCADCEATFPGWAVLPHGVFVCINCAQVHRGIGRHISQVKAVTTGTYLWYPDEYEAMARTGNDPANAVFAAKRAPAKPAAEAPQFEKENYIRAKYEHRRWFVEPTETPVETTPESTTKASDKGRDHQARSRVTKPRSHAVRGVRAAESEPNLEDLLSMDLRALETKRKEAPHCPTGILIDI